MSRAFRSRKSTPAFGRDLHSTPGSQAATPHPDWESASSLPPISDRPKPKKFLLESVGSQFGDSNLTFDGGQGPLSTGDIPADLDALDVNDIQASEYAPSIHLNHRPDPLSFDDVPFSALFDSEKSFSTRLDGETTTSFLDSGNRSPSAISGTPVREPRKRRKFSEERRLQVKKVREVGACPSCRKRKVACTHVTNRQAQPTTGRGFQSNQRKASRGSQARTTDASVIASLGHANDLSRRKPERAARLESSDFEDGIGKMLKEDPQSKMQLEPSMEEAVRGFKKAIFNAGMMEIRAKSKSRGRSIDSFRPAEDRFSKIIDTQVHRSIEDCWAFLDDCLDSCEPPLMTGSHAPKNFESVESGRGSSSYSISEPMFNRHDFAGPGPSVSNPQYSFTGFPTHRLPFSSANQISPNPMLTTPSDSGYQSGKCPCNCHLAMNSWQIPLCTDGPCQRGACGYRSSVQTNVSETYRPWNPALHSSFEEDNHGNPETQELLNPPPQNSFDDDIHGNREPW